MQQRRSSDDIKKTANLIVRLLNHYWTGNEPVEIAQAVMEDWLEDLAEFPPGVVEGACQRWRRTESRRPTPADIRKAAVEEKRDYPKFYGIEEQEALPSPQQPSEYVPRPSAEEIASVDAKVRECLAILASATERSRLR